MQHNWRTLIHSNDPRHTVKGHEIDVSIPSGQMSRFAVYSVRVINPLDFRYRVRDAVQISDAETKAGKRPPVVAEFDTLDEAEAYINANIGKM